MYYNIKFNTFANSIRVIMALRIKEVCREKGLKMSDLALKMGISPVSLSAAANGNPTIGWLQKVADIIGVEVTDLIEREEPSITGIVMIGDEVHIIRSKEDVSRLAEKIK